jgi:hypothetical protein
MVTGDDAGADSTGMTGVNWKPDDRKGRILKVNKGSCEQERAAQETEALSGKGYHRYTLWFLTANTWLLPAASAASC